ncbi:MAG: hypothetical protein OXU19_19800 [bacterium]|nr:hypothetical protein [bacterium]MDE0239511.1 hypothetical protein [bacterium]
MFGGSPIESWEGAAAIYSYAGSGGVHLFLWISVLLCVGTVVASIIAENRAEAEAKRLHDEQK